MMKDITIASGCYEKTFEQILDTDYCFFHYHKKPAKEDTFERLLIINDVSDKNLITKKADYLMLNKLRGGGYCFTNSSNKEVVEFWYKTSFNMDLFNCTYKGKLRKKTYNGFNYSIGALTALYFCKTKYMLWIDDDVYFDLDNDFNWLKESISFLKSNKDVLTTTCVWNKAFSGAKKESLEERGNFYISDGFSIQCFFIDVEKFKSMSNKLFFSEWNDFVQNKYPIYGGKCFEARLNAYMLNHGLKRAIYKYTTYFHEDINKNSIKLWKHLF